MVRRIALLALSLCGALLVVEACGGNNAAIGDGPSEGGAGSSGGPGGEGGPGDDGAAIPVDGSRDAAPAFTPASLGSRLVLWLDAAKGVGLVDGGRDASVISSWADQSMAKNDVVQANLALAPELNAATSEGGVGGLPAVAFRAPERISAPSTASLSWGTGDFAMFVVFRTTTAVAAFIIGKYDTVFPYPGPNLYLNYFAPGIGFNRMAAREDTNHYTLSAEGGTTDGRPHVAAMRRDAAKHELRIDGVSYLNPDGGVPDGGAVDVSAANGSFDVGCRSTGVYCFDGDIAEVIGLKGTVSDAEIIELETYLRTKYGIVWRAP
jgi:hypothetical protein